MQKFSSEVTEILTELSPDLDKSSIQKVNNPFRFQLRVQDPHIALKYFDAKTKGTLLVTLSPFTKKFELSTHEQTTLLTFFGTPFCEFTGNIAYEIHNVTYFKQMIEKVNSIPKMQLPKYLSYLLVLNDMSLTFKDLVVFDLKKDVPPQEVLKWGYFHFDSRQLGDKFKYTYVTKNVLLDAPKIAAILAPALAQNIPKSELERLIHSIHAEGEYTLEIPNKEGVINATIYTKLSDAEVENFKTSSSSQISYSVDPQGKLSIKVDADYEQKCKPYAKEQMIKMFRKGLDLKNQELGFAPLVKYSDHFQECFEKMIMPLVKFADNARDSLSISYCCSNINQLLHPDTEFSFNIDSWKMNRAGNTISLMAKTHGSAKFDDFVYECEVTFDQFNDSLKAILDYTPSLISSIMSMQYTTMLPEIPFTEAFCDHINWLLRVGAKEMGEDRVTFSIKGKNKEIESIGRFEFPIFMGTISQIAEQFKFNSEIEDYSQKLQSACQDHIKI